jgi:hypothetical protein
MVPPFLAYYGLTTGNQSMMQEAYNQVRFFVPSLKKKKQRIFGSNVLRNRLDCIVTTSLTDLPTDCGVTSYWVGVGQTLGIGRLARVYSTMRFEMPKPKILIDLFIRVGNGWAAAGMLRVLGTLNRSSTREAFQSQISDLENWVTEIHRAMYPYLVSFS